MAGPGPWPPGAGGSRCWEEALGIGAARRRPALAAFSAFSFIPPRREGPPELSYFNRAPKTEHVFTYDTIFRIPEGYNKYLPRCDRKHAKGHGLNINEEKPYMPDISAQVHSQNTLPLYQIVQEVLDAPKGVPGVPITITCSCLEMARSVPVLSSSEYGKRVNKPLEQPTKDHARANHLHAAIYGEKRSTR